MDIQVNSVNLSYGQDKTIDNARVHFTGNNNIKTLSLNGHMNLSPEDYHGNESTPMLVGVLKTNLASMIESQEVVIKINTTNINYNPDDLIETIRVYFNGQDEGRNIDVVGYLPIPQEEYIGNESIDALKELVKSTLITMIEVQVDNGEET